MAIVKDYNRTANTAGEMVNVQTLTNASTATAVNNYGLTTINSTAGGTAATHGFVMDAPVKGLTKTLAVGVNSTREVAVYNNSTACTFFGSTGNALTFSTGAGVYRAVNLIGTSTAQWAIVGMTTGVTVAASTVS